MCGTQLQRRTGEKPGRWAARKYCSRACAARKQMPAKGWGHGASAYKTGKCRCVECENAHRRAAMKRAWYQRRRRNHLPDFVPTIGTVWLPPADLRLPCTDADPDLWHPEHSTTAAADAALCAGCPVAADCYTAGVVGAETGIWGGVRLLLGQPTKKTKDTP